MRSTKGSITVESCICCVVLLVTLLLTIQFIGYTDALLECYQQLNERAGSTSITYYASGIYTLNLLPDFKNKQIQNIKFTALPYKDFFSMGLAAEYKGVLSVSHISASAVAPKWEGSNREEAKQNIWSMDPFERGDEIHRIMGANLDKNFPVLDFYDSYTKEAVAILSINTTDKTYNRGNEFANKLMQLVNALNEFEYGQAKGVGIHNEDINKKTVLLVVPYDQLTKKQEDALQKIRNSCEDFGIEFKVKKYQYTSSFGN